MEVKTMAGPPGPSEISQGEEGKKEISSVNQALERLVADSALRERLQSLWDNQIAPAMRKRILGAAHNEKHTAEVVILGARMVEGEIGANLEDLRENSAVKTLLAIALVCHDWGGVPEEGKRQAEVYPNHEIASAEKASQWMKENKEVIESVLEEGGISFDQARQMVVSLILATNLGVDFAGEPPLSQNLKERLEEGEEYLLQPREEDSRPVKEFKEKVARLRQGLSQETFSAFSQALAVISTADLGSYLKPIHEWLTQLATLYVEFYQGVPGEGETILFPRLLEGKIPPTSPESWLVSPFVEKVLATWGPWLPRNKQENALAIIAFQRRLVDAREGEALEEALERKRAQLTGGVDLAVRLEAGILPPDLSKLAEDIPGGLAAKITLEKEEISLQEAILRFGDRILENTRSGEGWGPMASEILAQMYEKVAPEKKLEFLRKIISLAGEKTLSGRPNIQIAPGRYLRFDPDFLSRLYQLTQNEDFWGKIFFTWRADEDSSEMLAGILEYCDGEKTGVALGGRLSFSSVREFLEVIKNQRYSGEITLHAGYWAEGAAGGNEDWRVIIEGINWLLAAGQRVIFHLDCDYQAFLAAMGENDWEIWEKAAKKGNLSFAISPFGELIKGGEALAGLEGVGRECRERGIKMNLATNNLTTAAGMGQLIQEAALLSTLVHLAGGPVL